jgi:predicted DNA-binding transcriptional regulator AlpA
MPNRLLRKSEVMARVSVRRTTLARRLADGTFPQPVYLRPGAPPLWPEDEIDAFIESLKAKRDAELPILPKA